MSLSCYIHVNVPHEGTFKPGQRISGIVRYTVYEDLVLRRIIISLKGNGTLDLEGKTKRRFRENYVNVEKVIREDSNTFTVIPGTYEEAFNFLLPKNIPPTIETKQETLRHKVGCNIQYYIRIKFDKGFFKAEKTFKKNIIVKSLIVPKLPMEPIKYEKFKVLKSPLYMGYVQIVAAIENCLINAGDKITVHYKLQNITNTNLVRVLISLVEVYSFKPNRPLINSKRLQDVENSYSASEHIGSGVTMVNTLEIEVPADKLSLEYSTLVTREYYVKLIVEFGYTSHSDIVLKMPIQIGEDVGSGNVVDDDEAVELVQDSERNDDRNERQEMRRPSGPPPSYWEIMGEVAVDEDEDVR